MSVVHGKFLYRKINEIVLFVVHVIYVSSVLNTIKSYFKHYTNSLSKYKRYMTICVINNIQYHTNSNGIVNVKNVFII